MRNMSRLSGLLLICLFVFAQGDDNDECEECGVQADAAIKTVGKMMMRIEPMTLGDVNPCKECYIYGIQTMVRNETVSICSKKTADGGYIHNFHVYFTNITLICSCNLNANPVVLTNNIASALKSSGKIKDCNPQKQLEAADSIKNGGVPVLTGPDMLKLTACKPKIGVIAPKTEFTGKIHAYWKDIAVSFNSVVAPETGKVNIKNILVLTKTFENLKVKCIGDKEFKSACQCLLATNFHTHLVVQAVYMILPCGLDERATSYDKLVQYFKCEV